MGVEFYKLSKEIWPMGTPAAGTRVPELYDYALGGLELVGLELERRATLALGASEMLLDMILYPDMCETTG